MIKDNIDEALRTLRTLRALRTLRGGYMAYRIIIGHHWASLGIYGIDEALMALMSLSHLNQEVIL